MKNMKRLILFFITLYFAHSVNAEGQAKSKKDKKDKKDEEVREKIKNPVKEMTQGEVQISVGAIFGTNTALNKNTSETVLGYGMQLGGQYFFKKEMAIDVGVSYFSPSSTTIDATSNTLSLGELSNVYSVNEQYLGVRRYFAFMAIRPYAMLGYTRRTESNHILGFKLANVLNGYTIGGGVDWMLSRFMGVNAQVKMFNDGIKPSRFNFYSSIGLVTLLNPRYIKKDGDDSDHVNTVSRTIFKGNGRMSFGPTYGSEVKYNGMSDLSLQPSYGVKVSGQYFFKSRFAADLAWNYFFVSQAFNDDAILFQNQANQIDLNIRCYLFPTKHKIQPYAFFGHGLNITSTGIEHMPDITINPGLNMGVGTDFILSPSFGLNVQYQSNSFLIEDQSNDIASVGFVFY